MDKLGLLSNKVVTYYYKDYSDDEQEIMGYGLRMILVTVIDLIAIVIVGLMVGVPELAVTAAISIGIIRRFSGGFHASTYVRCALLGTVVCVGLGLLANYLVMSINRGVIFILLWLVLMIGAILIYSYAPAGVKEKPLTALPKRVRLKISSFIAFFIVLLIDFSLYLMLEVDSYVLSSLFGVVWQIFTITPLAYKLFNKEYIRVDSIRKGVSR
ncbi:accessory gene regulator B [Orenia metallireducens]|uniref:Accessory gene regulator B n=1 Tax=Orenia metallireducens TaxID=1413210 RepID=A0A285G340_9FIRM|nr:accessory gene regulator B family protein [Orenia metallireducens]PRX31820.1 accessory gene regulator B [Orenia metallireducens]SNY17504.1 accessory gene regulator B [Orenia metallireducens]